MLRNATLLLALTLANCSQPPRQLDVSLLFHFNQDLVPQAHMASTAQYKGLLETLLETEAPTQVHISGTLLNSLNWFDRGAIDLIQDGLDRGQFELWGSTYSQNILVSSSDDVTNGAQVDSHRELMEGTFGVSPAGFWNPERVWTQSLVPLMATAGYRYVPIETHILEGSGHSDRLHEVRPTKHGNDDILIIHDDTAFKHLFNDAVGSGDPSELIAYLRELYDQDTEDRYLVAYFEDAEASGFWQFESGLDPADTFDSLTALIEALEAESWIRLTTTKDFLEGHSTGEALGPVEDGAANWMNEFAADLGFDDWYDYTARDSIIAYIRSYFEPIRQELVASQPELPSENVAARRLYDRAMRTFIAHEYEYGASWAWTPEWADYNLAREVRTSLLASRYATSPTQDAFQRDVTGDGVEEVVIVTPEALQIWSPLGGRLMYWFDLKTGDSLVGNENFNHYAEKYETGHRYQPAWRGGVDVYPNVRENTTFPEIFTYRFRARTAAFGDRLVSGSVIDSLQFDTYQVSGLSPAGVTLTSGILSKHVEIAEDRTAVTYTVESGSGELEVEIGVSPGYVEVMDGGPEVLETRQNGSSVRVTNTSVGRGVEIGTPAGAKVETGSVVFGVRVLATVPANGPARFTLRPVRNL